MLYGEKFLAFLASLLFMVHPVHVEAVASISGRADLLAAFFILLTIILYFKQASCQSRKTYLLTLLTFVCALLSKESALILPVLLLVYHYTFKKRINRGLFFSLVGIGFIYVFFRIVILKALLVKALFPYTPDISALLKRIPGFFVAIAYYLRILILPVHLRVDYGDRLFRIGDPRVILGILIISLLIAYALKKRNTDKLIFFSVAWFLIWLLPNANIYKINNSFMKEHWLYLGSIGFFSVLAKLLVGLYRSRSRAVTASFMAGVVLFYSSLTIKQNIYWNEPLAFIKRSLRYSPDNYELYAHLGREYERLREYNEATASYRKAVEIKPGLPYLYHSLGRCYKMLGRYEGAIITYKKAAEINPNDAAAYYELGDLYDKTGRKEDAVKAYQRAIEIDPHYSEALNNLAALYAESKDIDKAVELWNGIIKFNPDFSTAHFNLAVFYYKQGKYDLAIKHCNWVIRLGSQVDPVFLKLLEPYRKAQ